MLFYDCKRLFCLQKKWKEKEKEIIACLFNGSPAQRMMLATVQEQWTSVTLATAWLLVPSRHVWGRCQTWARGSCAKGANLQELFTCALPGGEGERFLLPTVAAAGVTCIPGTCKGIACLGALG